MFYNMYVSWILVIEDILVYRINITVNCALKQAIKLQPATQTKQSYVTINPFMWHLN